MSIQSEIERINYNVSSAYSAVQEKGGTVPEEANSDNLSAAISTIPELEGIPVKPVTESEYDALSEEEKNGETAWLVTDAEGNGSGDSGYITQEDLESAISNSRIVLTQAQYEELTTKSEDVLYCIKED